MTRRCRWTTSSGPWCNEERTIILDTGFTEAVAKRRKRDWLRCPVESLRLLGIDPDSVEEW